MRNSVVCMELRAASGVMLFCVCVCACLRRVVYLVATYNYYI